MLARLFARRYLFSPHSRSVVNLISGLSVAAVAMPVAAMIVLLSVFNGFESLVRSMYSAFDPDLSITPRQGRTFPAGAVFPLSDAVVTGAWRVREGDRNYLVVGQAMAWTLGIRSLADADVALYAVRRGSFSSLLPIENYTRRTVPVGGIFSLDLETEQSYVLTSLELAQRLFNYPDRVSSLVVRLAPGADAERVRRAVAEEAGDGFRVRTRDELRASFYRIMTYEKWGIFFIALLVLVVASFSVVGALAMLIVEKRDDIATLRALGADLGLVRSVFRAEGLLICALGAAAGVVLGVGASLVQQHFGLIEIPAETFLTKSYPVEFRPADLAAVLAAFAAVALLLTGITVRGMIKNGKR